MNLNEIEKEIGEIGDMLDLDMEIVDHLIQDMIFSKNFFVIDFEGYDAISQEFISNLDIFELDRFNSDDENKIIKAVHNEKEVSKISSNDCFLVISKSGEDNDTIKIVKKAMSKKALVYVLSTDRRSNLALNAYDFIRIKSDDDFRMELDMFFKMIISKLHYIFESDFFVVDVPPVLDKNAHDRFLEEKLASSGYVSPLFKRKSKKKNFKSVLKWILSLCVCILFLALFYGVIIGLGLLIKGI